MAVVAMPTIFSSLQQILTGLPAEGLVVDTDEPNFAFGDDTSVVAVDACSGLEVPVVRAVRSFVFPLVVEGTVAHRWALARDLLGLYHCFVEFGVCTCR